MSSWDYLFGDLREIGLPAMTVGFALACMAAPLSVLVVLKRLAFIGQGISHAAFGGVGVAAILGMASGAAAGATLGNFVIIFAFCLGAAMLIGRMSRRRTGGGGVEADTSIGIVLVASMALGGVLAKVSGSGVAWESFLFGSIIGVDWPEAAFAWGLTALSVLTLWLARRPLLFWAFDEECSATFGVKGKRASLVLMSLLALATVTAMKLAGVVLATALLVLPGAAALRMSSRLETVMIVSLGLSFVGVIGGLVLSFEAPWPPGPCIVLVLTLLFAMASAARAIRSRTA